MNLFMMKANPILFSIFLIAIFCICNAYGQTDSLIATENKNEGLCYTINGGLGMTTGSTWGDWEGQFNLGPTLDLGIELPFTKAHIFALQLYGFSWITHKNADQDNSGSQYKSGIDPHFKKLSVNYIYQVYFSGDVKYYLSSDIKKPRLWIHLNYLFYCPDIDQENIEFGFGLNYPVNDKINISLTRRMFFGHLNIGGSSNDSPNLLMLDFNYKIN